MEQDQEGESVAEISTYLLCLICYGTALLLLFWGKESLPLDYSTTRWVCKKSKSMGPEKALAQGLGTCARTVTKLPSPHHSVLLCHHNLLACSGTCCRFAFHQE